MGHSLAPLLPPAEITAGPLLIRRGVPDDAEALARAVEESLDHLRPWMPWATPESATASMQRTRLEGGWTDDDHAYLIIDASGAVVGGCGLHRRIGPGALEIGYWVHVEHIRRGYATTAAAALTRAALALTGIERVEIHCDEANLASAAVPRRLGYRLDRIEDSVATAPAETGRSMIWVTHTPPSPPPPAPPPA